MISNLWLQAKVLNSKINDKDLYHVSLLFKQSNVLLVPHKLLIIVANILGILTVY